MACQSQDDGADGAGGRIASGGQGGADHTSSTGGVGGGAGDGDGDGDGEPPQTESDAGGQGGNAGQGTQYDAGTPAPLEDAGQAQMPLPPIESFRVDIPCKGKRYGANLCTYDAAVLKDRLVVERSIGGTPGALYQVTAHVRALVEPMRYVKQGGVSASSAMDTPEPVTGAAPGVLVFRSYALSTTKPSSLTYLNGFHDIEHDVYAVDYQLPLTMEGGSRIRLVIVDGNDIAVGNEKSVKVPGVAPFPEVYDGQFIQVDFVTSAD